MGPPEGGPVAIADRLLATVHGVPDGLNRETAVWIVGAVVRPLAGRTNRTWNAVPGCPGTGPNHLGSGTGSRFRCDLTGSTTGAPPRARWGVSARSGSGNWSWWRKGTPSAPTCSCACGWLATERAANRQQAAERNNIHPAVGLGRGRAVPPQPCFRGAWLASTELKEESASLCGFRIRSE